MKKIIKKVLLSIVKSSNLGQMISDIENSRKINNSNSKVTNNGTAFYPEAVVENMQNDKSKIVVGKGSHIRSEMIVFPYGGKIRVGDNCYIGAGTRIWSGDSISIGNNVLIGHNINIIDFSHKSNSKERAEAFKSLVTNGHPKEKGNIPSRPIVIEDDVIIYAGSNIVMGVTIGKGSIVSAGSVVLKDVAPYSLVVGNPAKMVWKTR